MEDKIVEKVDKRRSGKWKVYLFLLLLLLAAGAYFYYWFNSTNALRQEALQTIEQSNLYDGLIVKIKSESDGCKDLISQKEGDFGGFEKVTIISNLR